ncbi:MAG: hypothetical protein GM48_3400 [actinobacterium acIB-AMD-7]|nr:MAG: hypothetical protein GM48_3400 [actinobacterium acIB-AMD-7]
MAREDMLIDEGATFGRRRRSTPTTPATAEEVQAALDAAAADLGVAPAGAQFESTELFSPISGAEPVAGASAADSQMFMREGFTPGPIPVEYQKLYGNDPAVIGWKVVTNPDGSQGISVALPQGDADGGLQFATYGATFERDSSGNVKPSTKSTASTTSTTSASTTGLKTAEQIAADAAKAQAQGERQSAYDLLYSQFKLYGLEALVEPLKGLITGGASPSEFTIKLRETDAYKKRFAANAQRIQKGLKAISEAEYLGLEDQYQNIMRNYGLPAEYYTRGDMGTQEGFNKFIANDVSATELEDRVMTAQSRVLNANPEVLASLKAFYPDITNGDILAYTLDPTKALTDIKRKVTAAEIGGAATQAGLGITGTRAGELGAAGITKAQAQQGFQTVAEVAPRGGQLAEIYKQSPYTQTTAEAEVFGLAGSAEAARQRKKLTSLETAAFSGSAGAGAIARDRAGVL